MSTGPKTVRKKGSGGARPNSGTTGTILSAKALAKLVAIAKKKAQETGREIPDVLVDLIYDCPDKRVSLTAIKLFYDVIRRSDATAPAAASEPGIFLPESQPDPAKVVTFPS